MKFFQSIYLELILIKTDSLMDAQKEICKISLVFIMLIIFSESFKAESPCFSKILAAQTKSADSYKKQRIEFSDSFRRLLLSFSTSSTVTSEQILTS